MKGDLLGNVFLSLSGYHLLILYVQFSGYHILRRFFVFFNLRVVTIFSVGKKILTKKKKWKEKVFQQLENSQYPIRNIAERQCSVLKTY